MTNTAQAKKTFNSAAQQDLQQKLVALLSRDLDFHDQGSGYASHNFHSFPAKFPPQLPYKFITALTNPGDVVLDPMMGSGTTVLEAFLSGRYAIGIDIDPLAVLISKVKVTPSDVLQIIPLGESIAQQASLAVSVKEKRAQLERALENRWDAKTTQFIDYWFARETQLELLALVQQIEGISDMPAKAFFELALSAIIVTKSGGVSLALDLGHTRPHKAKTVIYKTSAALRSEELPKVASGQPKHQTKIVRSPLEEFKRRVHLNLVGLQESAHGKITPLLAFGNAQCLPIANASVDLIVTSPPYASNAIDYMRAHKFSLVWTGHALNELSNRRKEYIGSEGVVDKDLEKLPNGTAEVVSQIGRLDRRKGRVLHRYYSEMTRALREMHRVIKPGRAAIVVVGSSVMRGKNTETGSCLVEIGKAIGFEVPKVGVRSLDRDRRMLPMGTTLDSGSQIQQRMHQEYVIGFLKPEAQDGATRGKENGIH